MLCPGFLLAVGQCCLCQPFHLFHQESGPDLRILRIREVFLHQLLFFREFVCRGAVIFCFQMLTLFSLIFLDLILALDHIVGQVFIVGIVTRSLEHVRILSPAGHTDVHGKRAPFCKP